MTGLSIHSGHKKVVVTTRWSKGGVPKLLMVDSMEGSLCDMIISQCLKRTSAMLARFLVKSFYLIPIGHRNTW